MVEIFYSPNGTALKPGAIDYRTVSDAQHRLRHSSPLHTAAIGKDGGFFTFVKCFYPVCQASALES